MHKSPFVMVIFGATGDLARNKLIPALFNLYKTGQLAEKFYIIGFARRPFSDRDFSDLLLETIDLRNREDRKAWGIFAKNLYYQQGLFGEEEGYTQLIDRLNLFDTQIGACITRFFYLATPPDNYHPILSFLESTKLSEGCGQGSNKWTRLIIEKPFGNDIETAKMLDEQLGEIFSEKQIFRVDHYLGKETVQNMIAFRFANGLFEPVWNSEYIDHVQITFAEVEGVDNRGSFFDGVGILRDVTQNHLMQLVATVAMEQPKSFAKEDVRDARVAAIQSIECIDPAAVPVNVVRGQYDGYEAVKGVATGSVTETFAAMKFSLSSERFRGVPFYIRAGKKMPQESVKISIVFRQTCHVLFKEVGCPEEGNVLTIHIQPNEGIGLRVIAKKPGDTMALGIVDMKFTYQDAFGGHGADAYETLLMDIFSDDQMLFNRSDELSSSWKFISNILTGWTSDVPVYKYNPGSWGPREADELIEKDGRKWL